MGSVVRFWSQIEIIWFCIFFKANGTRYCFWEEAAKQNSNDPLLLNTLQLLNMSDPPFYRHCSVWNNLLEWEITFTVFPHFGILFQQLNDSLAQIKDQSNMFSIFWTLLTSPDTSTWSFLEKCHILLLDYFDKSFVSCEIVSTQLGIRWCDVSPTVGGGVELHKLQI